MEFFFIASMEKKKSEVKSICHPSSCSIHSLSSRNAVQEATANFPQKNKGFIDGVFGRNWAVKNHVGTRLDSSSLVNKQVAKNPTTTVSYSLIILFLLSITETAMFAKLVFSYTPRHAPPRPDVVHLPLACGNVVPHDGSHEKD